MSFGTNNDIISGQISRKFKEIAKLPISDRHRILVDQVKTEQGKRELYRVRQAGTRYENYRVRKEIEQPRGRRIAKGEHDAIEARSPQPVPKPTYVGHTARNVPLGPEELKKIKQAVRSANAASEEKHRGVIRDQRLTLECKRVERIIEAEQREAYKARNGIGRQTTGPSNTRAAFSRNKRDMGLGD